MEEGTVNSQSDPICFFIFDWSSWGDLNKYCIQLDTKPQKIK